MRSLLALIVAVLLVVGVAAPGLAQEATPAGAEMPAGVSFELLAQAVAENLPSGPTEIALVRLSFDPGLRLPIEAEPGLAFVLVESGTFSVQVSTPVQVTRAAVDGTPVAASVSAAQAAFTLGPGESAVIPPLATGEVGNEGAEAVRLLAMFVGPPADAMATPEPGATPAPEEEMTGLSFEPLAFGIVEEMPAGPAGLAIARVTLEPGTTLPQQADPGAEVGYMEEGSFTFQTGEGPTVQVVRAVADLATPGAEPTFEESGPGQGVTVNAGDAFFIPPGSASGGTVEGDSAVVALIAVVEPLGAAAATPEG